MLFFLLRTIQHSLSLTHHSSSPRGSVFRGGRGLIINGNDRPATTSLLECLWNRRAAAVPRSGKTRPIYIFFSLFAFPSARPLPTPSSSPTDITEVLSLLRVQRRFSSGHDHPGFSNRDGTSFEERRANSWSFLPFLYPLSLPPRLTRPTLASHTNNIHADGTVTATSSLGPAFKCANEGDLLSGSQVHRGLNPAVLEPISAPFALALASVT